MCDYVCLCICLNVCVYVCGCMCVLVSAHDRGPSSMHSVCVCVPHLCMHGVYTHIHFGLSGSSSHFILQKKQTHTNIKKHVNISTRIQTLEHVTQAPDLVLILIVDHPKPKTDWDL